MQARRALVLVDGEHYPETTRWAIGEARTRGIEPSAALLVGGTEKLAADGGLDLGGLPVDYATDDLVASVRAAIRLHRPDVVLDLSDEPVLGYGERMLAIAGALVEGVPYEGADFRLEPPFSGPPLAVPTLAVIGTGKRTGKTAIAGAAARVAAAAGFRPAIVAMGRGGPSAPRVIDPGGMDLERLVELVAAGEHAASDYLEDALTTGVTTVGARRAGGGLAGRPFASNVREAADIAAGRGNLVILEGSGAAVPPVRWDAGVLCCPATLNPEHLGGYLGPFRVLLSQVVVFTMSGGPDAGPHHLTDLTSHVRRLRPDARVVVTDFLPVPLGEVGGKKVFFTTTAPSRVGRALAASLEDRFGCSVVGTSHRLGDRRGLTEDLERAPSFDALLTELKAAAVDVAAEAARRRGAEVVFVDNRAVTKGGDGELDELLLEAARGAVDRSRTR